MNSAQPPSISSQIGELAATIVEACKTRRAFAASDPGSEDHFLANVNGVTSARFV